jgi:hypothetical protein
VVLLAAALCWRLHRHRCLRPRLLLCPRLRLRSRPHRQRHIHCQACFLPLWTLLLRRGRCHLAPRYLRHVHTRAALSAALMSRSLAPQRTLLAVHFPTLPLLRALHQARHMPRRCLEETLATPHFLRRCLPWGA